MMLDRGLPSEGYAGMSIELTGIKYKHSSLSSLFSELLSFQTYILF